jgi:uncharacterized protein (TIGR03000 family)
MLSNMRRVFLVVVFSTIAGVGSFAWADHGHGDGHGFGGAAFSGPSFAGGHGHVSFGHFDGHSGFNNHLGFGGIRFDSDHHHFNSWPFSFYYRPYAYRYGGYPYAYSYFGYPRLYNYYAYPSYYYGYPLDYYSYSYPTYFSYPSDYYVNGNDNYFGDAPPPREYVVSRPVADVARLEVRLPDPQATIWVEGKEMTSSGTLRQFRSPQLDPAQQYRYNVKAQWRNNGRLFEDERQVNVQANASAVVDFTQPVHTAPAAQGPVLPDLPPPQPRRANE